jgi:hypothetical protein
VFCICGSRISDLIGCGGRLNIGTLEVATPGLAVESF